MALPEHDDLTTLVLRTDFRDDAAWDALCAAIDEEQEYSTATCASDPRFAEVSVQALIEEDGAAQDDAKALQVFLADATTMADPWHRLLAVDLYDQPGRTFRVPPRWFSEISGNLSIANTDFAEFADAADTSGTYRGFGDA
ncbi:hypothetical protein [Streptomyces sp. NPDC046197]|uniref:DUF6924 domain-containing protein n=1 Tax=Streptomyces sp. NPDC046197 TaxID=3154337 RepID=UPI0033FD66FC